MTSRSRLHGALMTFAVGALSLSTIAFAPAHLDTSRHVVVLADTVVDVEAAAAAVLAPLGLKAAGLYEHALKGFSVDLPVGTAAIVASNPMVSFVEADRMFEISAELPVGLDRIDADRISGSLVGTGRSVDVDVAVIDTGVDKNHRDLNVVRVIDCYNNVAGLIGDRSCLDRTGRADTGGDDDSGHGTHVAGTIGAKDNGLDVVGVAPGARIWSVKVLGGPLRNGSTSDIIAGIDYVVGTGEVEVINMSLSGSGTSSSTNTAIAGARSEGVVVVVAAGNQANDANLRTPANAPGAITVSAITDLDGKPGALSSGSCSGADDTFATYSNYGSVVDIAAPGSCITSTANGGGTALKSGTSMATPHVAGAAALYIVRNSVPSNAMRSATVLAGLLNEWSTPQSGACGYSNARSAEPLLLLVPCGNNAPSVAITAPSNGTSVTQGAEITFTATASDAEGGTTAISWRSSRDGALGSGASVTAELSVGHHTVTATTVDSAAATATDTVNVTVTATALPPSARSVHVSSIRWNDGFALIAGRYVDAWVNIVDERGVSVSGADVQVRFSRNGDGHSTQTSGTSSNGEAYFQNSGITTGCWSLEVLTVSSDAGDFDGTTPVNEYCF